MIMNLDLFEEKVIDYFIQVELVVDMKMRGICRKAYPGHPKGCPNFNKAERCPPKASKITDSLDLSQPVYAVYNKFDFGLHCGRMRSLHPEWSVRQVECCLYWQGTARKALKQKIVDFLCDHPGLTVLTCPEAQGVNITATMANAGIKLEWPPVNATYQVALAGQAKHQPG